MDDLSNRAQYRDTIRMNKEDRDLVAEEEVIKELENDDPEVAFFAPRNKSEDGVIVDAIREGHNILKESNTILERFRHHVYTEQEIYNELEVISLDATKICEAYLFLVKCPESARAIFGVPLQMRKKILKELIKNN
ncbi:hypothetical protein POM88_017240 [Heracleum sosnowskyi]|uniref:Uncharacterized protein n=1 Tax=Heracleum sosnowskyi TaxID=360622 RepID=A0AAD8INF9_9APIA|nr:hypothetical protein POM88_017240 [Heracleum sosnowskyi]